MVGSADYRTNENYWMQKAVVQRQLETLSFSTDPNVILGYAIKDVAVRYLIEKYPAVFERLGRKWDGDENSYCHVST